MKKRSFLVLAFLLHLIWGWSQYIIQSNEELLPLEKVPQEKVFLAHTGPMIFSGEYLYYSFYCFNAQTNRRSNISKMGYVALVNEEKQYVFEQKIRLDIGLGQGEFFVATDIPSGNYKLLGYTQWMKNNGLSQVYQENITVINPYQVDQSALLGTTVQDTLMVEKTESEAANTVNTPLQIEFEQKEYIQREKIKLSIVNYKGNLGQGTYSIRVQKKEEIPHKGSTRAEVFGTNYMNAAKKINKRKGDSLFLPEQRGELLFGTVTKKESKEAVSDTPVVISFPGKEFILKYATTDAFGNFYAYMKKPYTSSEPIFQIDDESEDYVIELKQQRKLDVSNLSFGSFILDDSMTSIIEKRSVYNQIENQFFQLKPDSILLSDPIDPFDGGIPKVIHLDDYTRFSTFQETLVEILEYAGYRVNPKGNDYVRLLQDFEKANEQYNDFSALVFIDGVYIPNHDAIKGYNSKKIKSVRLIQDQFQLANKQYQGMLAAETFDEDYVLEHRHKNILKSTIELPLPKKNYFEQRYNSDTTKYQRVPDYRTILFWKPLVTIDAVNRIDFELFTSDVKGTYEIILDGFTTYGKPISLTKTFVVN